MAAPGNAIELQLQSEAELNTLLERVHGAGVLLCGQPMIVEVSACHPAAYVRGLTASNFNQEGIQQTAARIAAATGLQATRGSQ